MLRNLDALTTEERVLITLQDQIPELVSKISKILICRDPLTQISRGICYLNFDNLVDSMNTFQALEKLTTLEIDGREGSLLYTIYLQILYLKLIFFMQFHFRIVSILKTELFQNLKHHQTEMGIHVETIIQHNQRIQTIINILWQMYQN